MRSPLVVALLCTALAGCTLLKPENAIAHGSVWLVSQADIHQAISAVRVGNPGYSGAAVDEVIVEDRSALYIYFHGHGVGYEVVRRIDGRWRYIPTDPADRVTLD